MIRLGKLAAIIFVAICAHAGALAQDASPQRVGVGFVSLENDPRYDEDLAYARIQVRPQGDALDGAKMGLDDMRIVSDAVGLTVHLDARKIDDEGDLSAAVADMAAQGIGFILADLPAPELDRLAAASLDLPVTILNVSATADALRHACHANLLHTSASDRMLADSFTQYLRLRNWTRALVLVGDTPQDVQMAASFRASAERLRMTIVDERLFSLSTNPEARELNNVQLLTSGVGEYDVVFIADTHGEFARYVPYSTSLPRPVIGSAGLSALQWHWSMERYGAPQVNSRFEGQSEDQRRMGWQDWSAWVAAKSVITAYAKSRSVEYAEVDAYLRSHRLRLDGSKGVTMNFRPWNGQLRQPLLLATDNATIAIAPLEGYLHQTNTLDTLGADEREFSCE